MALSMAFALMAVLLCGPASGALRVEVGDGMVGYLSSDQQIYLEALPLKGEGLLAFSRRLCGTEDPAAQIAGLNRSRRLLADVRYRVPVSLLTEELQRRVFGSLFPEDRPTAEGWVHQVLEPSVLSGESLWRVAEWFTGEGQSFRSLRRVNDLPDDQLRGGQSLLIPRVMLIRALRASLPAAESSAEGPLVYSRDASGEFALYRLRPGEALYSSVVVRFTGHVFAEDVNAVAEELAKLSGIEDVTDIPVGYRVRIPFRLLLPEYLPPGHPRRLEYEGRLSASAGFSSPVKSAHLAGVTVLLDAGHGGNDVGASTGGIWESLYVYDLMVRIKEELHSTTACRVVPTTRDGEAFRIIDQDVLPFSRRHQVLTTPPYAIEDSRVGVNLRWYLANSVYRDAQQNGADSGQVVFVSIHADSLHPALRGAMIYIPSARLSDGWTSRAGAVYAARKEVQEQPRVEFSLRDRTRSEGLSRRLAQEVIRSFLERRLPIHAYKPVRERIIRKRREFVPAVLRYNAVPAKILLEVCNLANAEDRRLIQSRDFRQQVAEAVVEGLLRYFGEEEPGEGAVMTAAGR